MTATISPETARVTVAAHRALFNALNREGWLDNFVDRPYLEEPAGSAVRFGREHYGALIDRVIDGKMTAHIEEPALTIVNGPKVAIQFSVTITADAVTTVSERIEIFDIAEDGRIAGIQTFVPPEALTHAPEPVS